MMGKAMVVSMNMELYMELFLYKYEPSDHGWKYTWN